MSDVVSDHQAPPEDGLPELEGLSPRELLADGLHGAAPPGRWMPPSAEQLARLLPQYQIEELLGHGGMGAVYKGTQQQLDRAVAIKILPAEMTGDTDFVARFQREARTLAKLQHPQIVAIHDFGQTREGHLFFVMEFVDGTDLAQVIRKQPLNAAQALELTIQICEALNYAHSKGVIHRDIKPANVLITKDGKVKLADFGLARPVSEDSPALTASHLVMGTPDYMAPEQKAGLGDHRADIYALGVMLYEMLTGKRPQGVFDPPSMKVQVDVRFDQVVIKAMQEEPERRYQQVREMRTDVDQIRSTPLPKAPLPRKSPTIAQPSRVGAPPSRVAARKKSDKAGSVAILVLSLVLALAVLFAWKKGWLNDAPKSESTETHETAVAPEPAAIAATPPAKEPSAASTTPRPEAAAAPVPSTTPSVTASTAPPTKGDGWINFLPLVNPNRDALQGRWTSTPEGLICESSGPTALQLPYEPPQEYDFRMVFTAGEGLDDTGASEAAQLIYAGGRQFRWMTAGGAPTNKRAGFAFVRGKAIQNSPASAAVGGPPVLNRRYESVVEVRRDGVTGYLDGKKLVEWKTNFQDMSLEKIFTLRDPRAIGIGFWGRKIIFHEIAVREVTGTGTFLMTASATTPKAAPAPHGVAPQLEKALVSSAWSFYDTATNGTGPTTDFTFLKDGSARVRHSNGDIRTWHWWATGPHRVHVQFSAQEATFDPAIGTDWNFDDGPNSFAGENTDHLGNPHGQRISSPSEVDSATQGQPFNNSLGMKFVPVPITGGPTNGQRVLFNVWDTRVRDYEVFTKETKRALPKAAFPQGPMHPAVGVNWDDANLFCKWLTWREKTEGWLPTGWSYRLPSDHEWSCAVGIGAREDLTKYPRELNNRINDAFPWGYSWPPPAGTGNYAGQELAPVLAAGKYPNLHNTVPFPDYRDGYEETSPVGSFTPNPLGLYDMAGNVKQWCEDWWDNEQKERVLRGSEWGMSARTGMLSASRHHNTPNDWYDRAGFRCVLAPDLPTVAR